MRLHYSNALALERQVSTGTPELLIRTAERLFAEKGIPAVTSREIREAAGQRNASAINYHFGDKRGLIRAIVDFRAGPLRERRGVMFAAVDTDGCQDLHAVVRAFVQPLADECSDPTSHYVGFLAQVLPERDLGTSVRPVDDPASNTFEAGRRLQSCLEWLPPHLLRVRFRFAILVTVNALAAHEAAVSSGQESPDRLPALVGELVDAIAGLLAAPITTPVPG
jgi:AcrR family transcriptional regulator